MGWIVSAASILVLFLMGRKYWWAPLAGLSSQVLWVIYVIRIHEWGLLVGVFGFTFVTILNAIKWTKERPKHDTH